LVFGSDFFFLLIIVNPRFDTFSGVNNLGCEHLYMPVNLLFFSLIRIQNGTELTTLSLANSQFLSWFQISWINSIIKNKEDAAAIVAPQSTNHSFLTFGYEANIR
jgi:hypothetical protein